MTTLHRNHLGKTPRPAFTASHCTISDLEKLTIAIDKTPGMTDAYARRIYRIAKEQGAATAQAVLTNHARFLADRARDEKAAQKLFGRKPMRRIHRDPAEQHFGGFGITGAIRGDDRPKHGWRLRTAQILLCVIVAGAVVFFIRGGR